MANASDFPPQLARTESPKRKRGSALGRGTRNGSAGLLNLAELSRTLGIPLNTLKRYLNLLEALFILTALPAWNSHLGKRLVKAPKVMLRDTGLMAHLMGIEQERLHQDPDLPGGVVGLEVKSSASIQPRDFKGLQHLSETLGPAFHRGVVLYTGRETLPFGPGMWAMPVSAIWQ